MVQKYREISVSISTIVDKRQKRGGSDRQTDGRTDRQTMDRAGPDPIHHSFFEKHSGTSVSIRETGVHFKFNASLTGNQVKSSRHDAHAALPVGAYVPPAHAVHARMPPTPVLYVPAPQFTHAGAFAEVR